MPNKYEREIEEILRNLDQSAPKARLSQRLRRKQNAHLRGPRRSVSLPNFNFGLSEWFLVIAWVAALIAGGWAFAHRSFFNSSGTDIFTGSVALISMVCLLMVVVLAFTQQSHFPGHARAGNVTAIRRNPLSSLSTRWNLFLLKRRYRRRKDQGAR